MPALPVSLAFWTERREARVLLVQHPLDESQTKRRPVLVFRAGLLELMRQPAFFGSYAAMGAMQTAVVALALGKNSIPMACESSLRFGARPAEQLHSFEVAAFLPCVGR